MAHAVDVGEDAKAHRGPAACRDETDHGRAGDAGKGRVDRPDPERDAVGRRDARLHQVRATEVGHDGEAARSRGLAIAKANAQSVPETGRGGDVRVTTSALQD